MNTDRDGAAVIAELCALGAAFGIKVIDDGLDYFVFSGAGAERFETLLMTAVQVGVLLERHGRAMFDAEHEAPRHCRCTFRAVGHGCTRQARCSRGQGCAQGWKAR